MGTNSTIPVFFLLLLFLCLFPSIAYPGLKLTEQHQVASEVWTLPVLFSAIFLPIYLLFFIAATPYVLTAVRTRREHFKLDRSGSGSGRSVELNCSDGIRARTNANLKWMFAFERSFISSVNVRAARVKRREEISEPESGGKARKNKRLCRSTALAAAATTASTKRISTSELIVEVFE